MSSEEIKIVHIDDDLVVVTKPASIPVSSFINGSTKVTLDYSAGQLRRDPSK